MTTYSKLQLIKRHMFAMRNGIIADTLRSAGSPFPVIFGMNLPQINETAAMFGPDPDMGRKLWNDKRTRESLLLAPMLMKADEMQADEAIQMATSVNCTEVADVLCLKLLKKLPCAIDIARRCLDRDIEDPIIRYCGVRLLWNLIPAHNAEAMQLAQIECTLGFDLSSQLAERLVEEINFLNSED